jgi:hypothetical protein
LTNNLISSLHGLEHMKARLQTCASLRALNRTCKAQIAHVRRSWCI